MKKSTVLMVVLFTIIIVGIFIFLMMENTEKLTISFLVRSSKSDVMNEDYGLIYQNLIKHTTLPMNRLVFQAKDFNTFEEFVNSLEETFKPRASNVVFCHFEELESYENFLKLKTYQSPLYFTTYSEYDYEQNQTKEVIQLSPPPERIAQGLNQLFNFNDQHVLLMINQTDNQPQNSVISGLLKGQTTTLTVVPHQNINHAVTSIGDILSTLNPHYLLIDLDEKPTIALLEKIVGFPRDKIILLPESTSERIGYYAGSNVYGINGITYTNPTQVIGFNNHRNLLKLLTKTITQCFVAEKKIGHQSLTTYLNDHPNIPIRLVDHSLITPIYRVSFSQKGLRVIDKLGFQE